MAKKVVLAGACRTAIGKMQKKRSLQFLVHRTERAYPIFDKSP